MRAVNPTKLTDEDLVQCVRFRLQLLDADLNRGLFFIILGFSSFGVGYLSGKDISIVTVAALALGYAWLSQSMLAATFAEYLRRLNDRQIEQISSSSLKSLNFRNALFKAVLLWIVIGGVYFARRYY